MLAKLLKISKKSHGNPRKTPLLWQTFFLKGWRLLKPVSSLQFLFFLITPVLKVTFLQHQQKNASY